jgi:hypothetical protein
MASRREFQRAGTFVADIIAQNIVANFSTPKLYWHGLRETNRCIPDIYHALKAVAYVPFGILLRVEPYTSSSR